MRTAAAFLCIAATALADATPPVEKQPATKCPLERARDLFKEGVRRFERGEYDRAAAAFEQAYACRATPALLYNIAQAYREAHRPCLALSYYRRYRHEAPSSPAAAEVEQRIRELEGTEGCKAEP